MSTILYGRQIHNLVKWEELRSIARIVNESPRLYSIHKNNDVYFNGIFKGLSEKAALTLPYT